jgi:hypothetical protein
MSSLNSLSTNLPRSCSLCSLGTDRTVNSVLNSSSILACLFVSSTELSQLLTTNSNDFLCPFITPRLGPSRKLSRSTVEKACLRIRYLAMDIILLCAYASAGMCLASLCLAMELYVTVYTGLCMHVSVHVYICTYRGLRVYE